MNYATWKLNFANPEYGTGPEEAIADLGFGAVAAWSQGEPENGGTILGYVTEPVDESQLTPWDVQNITQAEALAFCTALNPEAYLTDEGTIVAPVEMPVA